MGLLFVLALAAVSIVPSVTAAKVTIYSGDYFRGVNHTLDVTTCVDLIDKATIIGSIDTHENCVHLYKSKSCNTDFGQFLRVQPGMQSGRLNMYGYRRIKSIGPCHRCFDSSSTPTIQLVPSYWKSNGTMWWPNPDKLEANFSITGCQNTPQEVTKWASLTPWLTAYLARNVCIEVFHLPGCSGHSAQFLSTSSEYEMTFLLHLNEAKSFSACRKVCADAPHCGSHEYRCRDGYCLDNAFQCNGEKDCMEGEDEENCAPVCPRGLVNCPNTTRCVPFTSFCEDCADVPGACDTTKIFTTTPDTEMHISGMQKISFIGKYRWERIMNIDNSRNSESVTRTSVATTTIVTNYISLLNSIKDNNYGISGGIEIKAVNIKGNFKSKQSYERSIETKTYNKVERTITDKYECEENSNLTLYQLVFDGPGISEATETIASTPVYMADVNITFTIQKIMVLKGITVVYTDDSASRPSNHIREARDKKADINDGHGGEYVWLVPEFTQDYSQGVTGMEIVVQNFKNTSFQDLTRSSRSKYYKYLLFLNDTTANVRITDVVIFRSSRKENADPKTFGWLYCTTDVFEYDSSEHRIEYLYICWKTVHYEEPSPTSNNTLQVAGTYSWELMLSINTTGWNSTKISRTYEMSTTTESSYNRLMKSVSETEYGGEIGIDLTSGIFKILNVGVGFEMNINAQARSSMESSVQNQTDIRTIASQTDEYVIGPNSCLTLYKLILNAPGFHQETNMISSTPDQIDDIEIGLTLKQTLVLSGIDVVYTKHTVNRPKDHISDVRFLQPGVNWGFSGERVFLVPRWTVNGSEGVTGFEVVTQGKRNNNFIDLAPGSGDGIFRYLVPTKNPILNTRITRVALYRRKYGESFSHPNGWDQCTSDINDGRPYKKYLYLCWKSTPFQDTSTDYHESDYNFGGYISPLSSNSTSPIKNSRDSVSTMIVKGIRAKLSEFPSQVSIQVQNGKRWFHFCGGVIVALNKVITAGHCCAGENMKGKRLNSIRIVAGVNDIEKVRVPSMQIVKIKRIDNTKYKKPRNDKEPLVNDVCKLHLKDNLKKTKSVQTIELCKTEPTGGACTASGWGSTNNDKDMWPRFLQKVELRYVTRQVCKKHYKKLDDSVICAGGSVKGQGICDGDSGGPLICNVADQRGCLAGITSWSLEPCATPKKPDAFANVANLLDFIRSD